MQESIFEFDPQTANAALWQKLQQSEKTSALESKEDDFYHAWLTLQCSSLSGVMSALVIIEDGDDHSYKPASVWPNTAIDTQPLSDIIERVIDNKTALVVDLPPQVGGQKPFALALPILNASNVVAVIAVQLNAKDEQHLQQSMRQLQWGSAWLSDYGWRQSHDKRSDKLQMLSASIDVLAKILAEKDYDTAVMSFTAELSKLMQCDVVAFGVVKKQGLRVQHISNHVEFGKKMNLVRAYEAAMDEAVDQKVIIQHPGDSPHITLAHGKLSSSVDPQSCFITFPLFSQTLCIGAVTLQRRNGVAFDMNEIKRGESILAFAAAVLHEKKRNDRHLGIRIKDDIEQQLARLFGRGYIGRKLLCAAFLALVAFLSIAQGQYRLSSNAIIATVMQRVVVAPFDTYIQEAPQRAGDRVSQGDLLVQFDNRDLQLEKLHWKGQLNQLQRQYQEAVAAHDRSNITIIVAQMDQAKAKLALTESQLSRATLSAPFDGMVVSGDLTQRLGGAVTKGDVLFEVSPLKQMRVFLHVKENRIADVQVGQTGTLYLSALPDTPLTLVVDKLTPQTLAENGTTFFKVEALLQGDTDKLQPGMEGIGKIEIDRRKLVSIWTRELLEWIRLRLWAFWG